jgi:hypothetical protein
MPEKDFLEWINSEAMNSSEIPNNSDTIYRQAAIDSIQYAGKIGKLTCIDILKRLPPVQPENPNKWIPMVRREPTDEEKAEYLAQNGEEVCYMLENEMPLNGQVVLVSIGKHVLEDVFYEDFYNFENNDIENVDAWMPLPESYEEGK